MLLEICNGKFYIRLIYSQMVNIVMSVLCLWASNSYEWRHYVFKLSIQPNVLSTSRCGPKSTPEAGWSNE